MKRLDASLAALLDNLPVPEQADRLERIRLQWAGICGTAVAGACEPLAVEGRLLVVGVYGGRWREALFQERGHMSRRLAARFPSLRGVRLRTLPDRLVRPPVLATPDPPAEPDPANADVQDVALRAELDAVCAAWRRARRREEQA